MKVSVILPAAGLGTRMGRRNRRKAGTSRKQFMLLDGLPILVHTVSKFVASPAGDRDRRRVAPEDIAVGDGLLAAESQIKADPSGGRR